MNKNYEEGNISREIRDNWVATHEWLNTLDTDEDALKPVALSYSHPSYGQITMTMTDEGWRQWRKATVKDVGKVVYYFDCVKPRLGVMKSIEKQQDEEFPDVWETVAIVHTQSGMETSCFAEGGVFESIRVIPDSVARGLCNEAPPGSCFSGKTIRLSNQWTPAPEGKVWYHHPHMPFLPRYLTDFEYYFFKRQLEENPTTPLNVDEEIEFYECNGQFEYWCPVKCKLMSEGEMLRQEHWFHNGDGSARQRRYYTQNEMLDRHGGLSTLPRGYDESGALLQTSDGSPQVVGVRTMDQAVNAKFKNAEKSGAMIDLS